MPSNRFCAGIFPGAGPGEAAKPIANLGLPLSVAKPVLLRLCDPL